MSIVKEWNDMCDNASQKDNEKFFQEYFVKEKDVYAELLSKKENVVEGTVEELAKRFNLTNVEMIGFIDGINTSLNESVELDSLDETSQVKLDIDWKKLYENMLAVPAEWLFNLEEWDNIYSEEERKQIKKDFNLARQAHRTKVGRNDPCPCGSGKKYKKCCGAQD